MHSSALGAADLMALRSFSSAARFSLLNGARYSSMVCGLAGFANTGLSSLRDQRFVLNRRVPLKRLFGGVGQETLKGLSLWCRHPPSALPASVRLLPQDNKYFRAHALFLTAG